MKIMRHPARIVISELFGSLSFISVFITVKLDILLIIFVLKLT